MEQKKQIEIKLGDKVKDIHTNFVGIAVYKTEFLNGCIQFGVAPKVGGDNKIIEEAGIDSQSLIVIKKGSRHHKVIKKKVKEKTPGGANKMGIKQRGY